MRSFRGRLLLQGLASAVSQANFERPLTTSRSTLLVPSFVLSAPPSTGTPLFPCGLLPRFFAAQPKKHRSTDAQVDWNKSPFSMNLIAKHVMSHFATHSVRVARQKRLYLDGLESG